MKTQGTATTVAFRVAVGLAAAQPTAAGLSDTPVPELRGERAKHVSSVTGGVASQGSARILGTSTRTSSARR